MLRGNLAPNGAVIKPPAAEARLHRHAGKAVVFDSYNEMAARIDDPDLDVDANSVLVLRNAGPLGAPGMPEWGQLPIPQKLLQQGVRDMLRISDARMSGTSYGACVLHVAPESFVGGPLALVARRRRDRARHSSPAADAAGQRGRAGAAAVPSGGSRPRLTARLWRRCSRSTSPRPIEGCDFDYLERGGADRRARNPLTDS